MEYKSDNDVLATHEEYTAVNQTPRITISQQDHANSVLLMNYISL